MLRHRVLSSYTFGDIIVRYLQDQASNVEINILPAETENEIVERRPDLSENYEVQNLPQSHGKGNAYSFSPLVQLKCVGDDYAAGFSQGRTLLNSSSTTTLKYHSQSIERDENKTVVTTLMTGSRGYTCEHVLTHYSDQVSVEMYTVFHNTSSTAVELELLSSFAINGITPYDCADASGRLHLHRYRTTWSAEGRHESIPLESLLMENSWHGHSVVCERFGQVGSKPVHGFFPFVAIEDTKANVIWGAQLAWAGSWQMEVYRKGDCVLLAGGLADREFGHWKKRIQPNQRFSTPTAIISTVRGSIDELCQRLTVAHDNSLRKLPVVEEDLPIVCNDWCTNWGETSEKNVIKLADKLKGTDVKYLIIDAGWYKEENSDWTNSHGDWTPNKTQFPGGLANTAKEIRKRGLIPGIWFEMETVGPDSNAHSAGQHFLTRDGIPISSGGRRFWDFRDPFVFDYLSRNMVDLIEQCGFGYLKLDYNETIGIGADDPDSLGEGLRQHIEGLYRFINIIRSRLPDLVIENCSSGGHRLEPSMMALSSMASFSDAHETKEIPIIAANLHNLILPKQSQIWAVLRKADDLRRLSYSLAATFLGRMCISGDICELSDEQWATCLHYQRLYRKVWHIIKDGISSRFGTEILSYRHPKGWQAILRVSSNHKEAILVMHSFAYPVPQKVEIELPDGNWQISDMISGEGTQLSLANSGVLQTVFEVEFTSCVAHLIKL